MIYPIKKLASKEIADAVIYLESAAHGTSARLKVYLGGVFIEISVSVKRHTRNYFKFGVCGACADGRNTEVSA